MLYFCQPMLKVQNLYFSYKNNDVLENVSFQVDIGENLAIIGESGSGKSTLLKLLYGTYDLKKGHIVWKDNEILGPKSNLIVGPEFMKYVSQEFDLMPYTTVAENVGAFLSNFYPEEKQNRIQELLEVVELTNFSKVKVKELSGGQKQRVALARALAKEPEILLLDEPFSHIDNFKKNSLRRSLFHYLKTKKITCIVATHDKDDIVPFSDNMIVLHDSKILAENNPKSLYKNPESPLVASFFGEYNVIEGKIIYAHQIKIVDDSELTAIVKRSYFVGDHYLIKADYKGNAIFFENDSPLEPENRVSLRINPL